MTNQVNVEYLYLDLNSCDRCIGTDNVLDEVMAALTPALKIAGYEVFYKKIEMKDEELAGEYKFVSSPTIRVNGKDICQSVTENNCGCCSDISGTDVDCRVFEYQGVKYEVPPKEMIASSILETVFVQTEKAGINEHYDIPKNLKVFYKGKKSKSECSCGGNCCSDGVAVKILGSGCAKCNKLEAATREALEQLGLDTTIDHVTDFAQIAAYGVMSTPALVVDGKVVSFGKVLKTKEVVNILQKVR